MNCCEAGWMVSSTRNRTTSAENEGIATAKRTAETIAEQLTGEKRKPADNEQGNVVKFEARQ